MPENEGSDNISRLRSQIDFLRRELYRLEDKIDELEAGGKRVTKHTGSPPFVRTEPIPPPKPPAASEPAPKKAYQFLSDHPAPVEMSLSPSDQLKPISATAKAPPRNVEVAIGKTWLNRVGAIILLLGIGFFVKYSFDQGLISPALRVCIGAVVGLALIVMGEVSLRKGMRPFATGMLGCGTAALYLSSYAAHAFYGLISTPTAFALLCLVTALSTVLAVRGRMLAIAILALVGGFWTPPALSTGKNEQIALLTYLAVLDIGFLACCLLRHWGVLRLLSWVGSAGMFFGWAVKFYQPDAMWITLGYALLFYLLFLVESQVGIRRSRGAGLSILTLITILNNAIFFASVYYLAHVELANWMGLFAVAMGLAQVWLALGLRRLGERAFELLESHSISGAAMLALAAPLQFDRYWVPVAWGVQAIVTFAFCRSHARPWFRIKACGILAAALGHLVFREMQEATLSESLFTFGNWHLTWLIVLFVGLGVCSYGSALALAARRALDSLDKALVGILIAYGTALMLWIFWYSYEQYVATWWWLGLAVCWYALSRRVQSLGAVFLAIILMVVGKYFLSDTLGEVVSKNWDKISGVIFNRMVLTGVLLSGAVLLSISPANELVSRLTPGSYWHKFVLGDALSKQMPFLAVFIITWAGSFEVVRIFHYEPRRDWFSAPEHAGAVILTGWWVVNAAALWAFVQTRMNVLTRYALVLTWWCVIWFALHDTALLAASGDWSVLRGVASNGTFFLGLGVIANTFLAYQMTRNAPAVDDISSAIRRAALALLAAALCLIVWLPTFEILRVFHFEETRHRFSDPRFAMHVVLSVFWALTALVYLSIGFARMVATLRYMAIGLFALTVAKVLLVDMANLEMIYRIVSFVVLGGLLLLASYLYQKLSEKILHPQTELAR